MEWLRKAVAVGQRAPFPEFDGPDGDRANEALFTTLLAHFDLHQAQGHRSCARELLELAQQLTSGEPDLHYRWLRKWARWLESVGRRDEALDLLEAHLRRLRGKLRNPTRNAELRMELGILMDRAGRKEEALRYFKDAASRYGKLNHAYNMVAALFNTASVLHDLGHHAEALKTCRKALVQGAPQYRDLSSHISLQMANSLEAQKLTAEASEHYRTAEESYGQLGNRRQQSDILYRMGWLAVRAKHYGDAARMLRTALEIKREQDYAIGLAWHHWARAEACRGGGALKKAVSHYKLALNLALSAQQDAVAAHCRIKLYTLCARPEQSLTAFTRYGNASSADAAIKAGRAGLYLDHGSDGYSADIFREPGDAARPRLDRKVLVRLVHDLERVLKANGVAPHASLQRQRQALTSWTERQLNKPG